LKKTLKILIPVLVILGLVLTAGCAKAPPTTPSPLPPPGAAIPESPRGLFGGTSYESQDINAPNVTTESGAAIDRKIVKTGYMNLEVNDITEAIAGITKVANELNGYIVSSDQSGTKDITYGRIAIRVPSDRFDEALDKIRKLAVKVPNESTSSQDVTEEYTDLQAQLRNLEATEAQYLEILKKAEKVEDILAVQRELSNVRGQIEQIKGRIQYLERTSDMALIEVNLQKTQPIDGTGWNALETLKSAVRGLATFGKALANIVIWLAIFSPVWIIILVVVLYFTRWRKKKARTSR
jgi:predicted component of type VI protein secretion system